MVKHAGVKTAQVALTSLDGSLAVRVSDQGHGFNIGVLDSPTLEGLRSFKPEGARQPWGEPFNGERGGKRQQLHPEGSRQLG